MSKPDVYDTCAVNVLSRDSYGVLLSLDHGKLYACFWSPYAHPSPSFQDPCDAEVSLTACIINRGHSERTFQASLILLELSGLALAVKEINGRAKRSSFL